MSTQDDQQDRRRRIEAAKKTYFALAADVVGNPSVGLTTVYGSSVKEFPKRAEAISHGFETYSCDDFLIGIMEGGKLVGVAYMDEDRDDGDEIIEVAKALGLERVEEDFDAGSAHEQDCWEAP